MTFTLDIAPEMEIQMRNEAARAGLEPERYVLGALQERLGRAGQENAPMLPRAEAELLDRIDLGVMPKTWDRYYALIDRRDDGTLTEEQHRELISLSDEIELANARRVGALVELAKLRHMSIEELMQALGIPAYTYV